MTVFVIPIPFQQRFHSVTRSFLDRVWSYLEPLQCTHIHCILFPLFFLTLLSRFLVLRLDFNGCDMMMIQHQAATNNTAHLHSPSSFLYTCIPPRPRTVQIFHKYSPPESDVTSHSEWLASQQTLVVCTAGIVCTVFQTKAGKFHFQVKMTSVIENQDWYRDWWSLMSMDRPS